MAADGRLKLLFAHIAALRDNLLAYHDGWSSRQSEPCILLALIGLSWLGDDLDFNSILCPQPGNHLAKMVSRFPPGIVNENLNLQHLISLHYMDWLTVTQLLVSKEAAQDSFLFRFRFRCGQPEMTADGSLQLIFVDITALHHQLIRNHNGRSHRQPQLRVFFGPIRLKGFGCGLDFQFVLFPQPGDNFGEMPSGPAAGLV